MTNNLKKIIPIVLVMAAAGWFLLRPKPEEAQTIREVRPRRGDIRKVISATAAVQPQNRLEMKPPVAGRIDQILVEEGKDVKAGDTVALMSSTERAALLDSAKSKGEKELKYWEEIYKPIPLIAPIDGQVIVSTMQPGQAVAQTDPIVVLSNRLIVQAQVDETDIGRVKEGQDALITLDAYPDIRVKAAVGHIYHESKVVNNVTVYNVDILPETVPDVFRSGMSANVSIVQESRENVLLIPLEAVKRGRDGSGSFVFVSQGKGKKPAKQEVTLGISDDADTEVVSGIDEDSTLVIITKKYMPAKGSKGGSNPFGPPQQKRSTPGGSGGGGSSR
jgi:macrolide-specific efflux system membrane fusion protein